MPTTILMLLDEVNCKFANLDVVTRRKLTDAVKFYLPYAKHLPAVRLGRWDGSVSYCDVAGRTYINLLDRLLPIVQQQGYDIEIDDRRTPHSFEFERIDNNSYSHVLWPKGHPLEGKPVVVKDHQVDVINTYLENLTGINIAPTGSGKCLAADTRLPITVDHNTAFGAYFHSCTPEHDAVGSTISIGRLVDIIQLYTQTQLQDCQELNVYELGIMVDTPSGMQPVHHVIKKPGLPMVKITLETGYTFRCAEQHIVRIKGHDVYARAVAPGAELDHRSGVAKVASIEQSGVDTCFDISVPEPHLYYDAGGVVHHNTIITAILSHKIEPYGRSIVIVPTKDLVTQTEADYINFGLDVGVFYGDRKDYGKKHTICTWQSIESLAKRERNGKEVVVDTAEFFDGVVCVIADECHKAKADVLKKILSGPLGNAPIRWGMTGTMPETEMDQVGVISCIGPVLNRIETTELQEKGILAKLHINIWQLQDLGASAFTSYQSELKWLTTSRPRLEFLAGKFAELAETGNTLILVDRVETGKALESMIPGSRFIYGQTKSDERKDEYSVMQDEDGKLLIASFGIASTGININRIFNLVLFEAGKSFVRVIQSIGRGIRVAQDKDFVNVYDVCSVSKYSKQHSTRRKKFYNEYKYPYSVTKLNY